MYSGMYFASTTSIRSSDANVLLAAIIELREDADPSDQKIRFINLDLPRPDRSNPGYETDPYFLTGWLTPQAIQGLPGMASVSAQALLSIGSLDSRQFTIGILEERCGLVGVEALVTVSKPLDDFVTGEGILWPINPKENMQQTNVQESTSAST
jgi:hypothetical protein